MFFTSCAEKVEVTIDNPTDTPVTVSIDGKEAFVVPPFTYHNLPKLEVGGHLMSVDGGKSISFYTKKPAVMLNPTLSTYVVVKEKYGDDPELGINFDSRYDEDNKIYIDSVEYTGPFRLIDQQYCIGLGSIDLDIEMDFPETVKVSSYVKSWNQKKLFRKADFIEYYDENYKYYNELKEMIDNLEESLKETE